MSLLTVHNCVQKWSLAINENDAFQVDHCTRVPQPGPPCGLKSNYYVVMLRYSIIHKVDSYNLL